MISVRIKYLFAKFHIAMLWNQIGNFHASSSLNGSSKRRTSTYIAATEQLFQNRLDWYGNPSNLGSASRRIWPCNFGKKRPRTRGVRAKMVSAELILAQGPLNVNMELWVLTNDYLILARQNSTQT